MQVLGESSVEFRCYAEESVYGEADGVDIDKKGKPYVRPGLEIRPRPNPYFHYYHYYRGWALGLVTPLGDSTDVFPALVSGRPIRSNGM